MKKRTSKRESLRTLLTAIFLPCLILAALFITRASLAGDDSENERASKQLSPLNDPNMPAHIDARIEALSRASVRELEKAQQKAIVSLQNRLGGTGNLKIVYNNLTATPSRIINPNGYLTDPSGEMPEVVARNFIRQNSGIFRFDENDLNTLKLRSRAVTQEGTTILLFQQMVGEVPVYQGEVLVNVSKTGQIINVGGMNYPQMNLSNGEGISAAQAVVNAAQSMNISYSPQALGEAKILVTHGNLKPVFTEGEKFSGGYVFSDDISVQKVVFPLGAEGRLAYKFVLRTPQYYGIMWQNIVDAQTGEILQRLSLTAFQNEPGGGTGNNRRASYRPDVQNMLESYFQSGGGSGKVFDTNPATVAGAGGRGRPTRTGSPGSYIYSKPTYDAEVDTNTFRFSIINARNESPLFFAANPTVQTFTEAEFPGILGQVTRGMPTATYPTSSSPFGWFYLPTGTGGAEILTGDANRSATRVAGYTISAEAKTRNLAANSPTGDGSQPFSADVTPLGASVTLNDGRVLSSVIQSRYTEGNNVIVAEDRSRDNNTTRGIKGYSVNRQFTAPYFDYYASYEFGGVNATGGGTGSTTPVVYPPSANADVFPGTVSLFYLNNLQHDYMYSIGFTEQMWNFQFDNFGKGGAGGDGIIAEVQDGSGTNNANMGTPDEGGSPTMQMFLFTDGSFHRSDGDFDWDVVAHEGYHGVSNRSAGKGLSSCLGTPLVGEAGGMGEGWGDFVASSLADDDSEGEYLTGDLDKGIRRVPVTNYRYSYGAINNTNLAVRQNISPTDNGVGDQNVGGIPFEVHDIGEVWSAVLWDMRELFIVKQKVGAAFPGIFFDGNRRTGTGTTFFIGERAVQSVDAGHPINYRLGFATDDGTVTPFPAPVLPKIDASDIVRPGVLAAENASGLYPRRSGPLATAVSNGARLADKITLRGLQLAPCNPTFVDMRDVMIAADREITGGENVAVIWRAFASHGIGALATSPNSGSGGTGAVVEDFSLPANVSACELSGPLAPPSFSLSNTTANTVTVTITPLAGATDYVIQRSTSASGPFTTIATTAATTYQDSTGINVGNTYYYQVHARRNADCVGRANLQNITVTVGTAPIVSPIFFGADSVTDPNTGTSLTVNWSPASSANPSAAIVYDVYRVINVALDNDLTAATFTPTVGNRIAQNLTGTSYTDTNLTTGQQYYYIVRARDTNNNQTDTNNVGNTRTRLNAPTTNTVASTPFALEDFSQTSANNRFTPPLTDSATPDVSTPVFQRVPNAILSVANSDAMYAPDFDPGNSGQGGPSNFASLIGPLTLTRGSILEFDHRFSTEAAFDGNNLEVVLGAPTVDPTDATPFPNNTSAFELNDYLIQGGYSGPLNGTVEGAAILSPLQGRLSFTGTQALTHVRAALGDFAPGGVRNPDSLPVYVRFHTSSDVGTNAGDGSGWYVDNLVVNNFGQVVDVSIAGTITKNGSPLSGVSVALSGSSSATTTTNASGQYSFAGLTSGGNYLVTPSLNGHTFEPNYRSYTNVQSNVTNADFVAYDDANFPRKLTIVNSFATPGQNVTVPVTVISQGNEEGFGFSVSYDSALLSNPQIACGSDAAGCVITTNAGSGAIGIVIDNVSLTAGTRQIATVTFATTANPPNTASNTPVGFVNSPTPRSVSNGNGDSLAASYVDGLVVFAQNLECDVAGRFTGDNDVLTNDITIMRQFVARNITPNAAYNEFQRADCGPRGESGDGQILTNDLIQTRRYAARNDALQPAAGPAQEIPAFSERTLQVKESNVFNVTAAAPVVRIVSQESSRGTTVVVPVEVDVSSDVVGFSLSVEFDRTKLIYGSTALGSGVPAGSTLTLNTNKLIPSDPDDPIGKIGIVVDSGNMFANGTRQLVNLTFTVASNAPFGLTPLTISADPTPLSTSDSQGNLVITSYTNGNVNIAPPTSATVSVGGRVTDENGTGVSNAEVSLVGGGTSRIARTNGFGYYRFDDVEVGETYVIGVTSKRYTFAPRTLMVLEETPNVDFTPEK